MADDIARSIVYLNREQFETLRTTGSITVGEATIDYNDKDIYVVTDDGNVVDYNPSLTYTKGDIVYYEGKIYTPIVESVIGVEPTNTTEGSWKSLTSNLDTIVDNLQDTVGTNSTNIVNLDKVKADKTEVVTLNTDQVIAGAKTFTSKITADELEVHSETANGSSTTILNSKNGITVTQDGNVNSARYAYSAILYSKNNGVENRLDFPTKSGTLALTSDIPTNYLQTDTEGEQTVNGYVTFDDGIHVPGLDFIEPGKVDVLTSGGNVNVLTFPEKDGTLATIEDLPGISEYDATKTYKKGDIVTYYVKLSDCYDASVSEIYTSNILNIKVGMVIDFMKPDGTFSLEGQTVVDIDPTNQKIVIDGRTYSSAVQDTIIILHNSSRLYMLTAENATNVVPTDTTKWKCLNGSDMYYEPEDFWSRFPIFMRTYTGKQDIFDSLHFTNLDDEDGTLIHKDGINIGSGRNFTEGTRYAKDGIYIYSPEISGTDHELKFPENKSGTIATTDECFKIRRWL